MIVENINIKELFDAVKNELQKEKNISPAFKALIKLMLAFIQILSEKLHNCQAGQFNPKSEKVTKKNMQLQNDPEVTADKKEFIKVASHTREKNKKTKGSNIDTSKLPEYVMRYDIPEEERVCKCCNSKLVKVGEDENKQIEKIPMLLYVVKHTRCKYSCKKCNSMVMPGKAESPLNKALAGGSLIADVVINKFAYHLPLYRQSKILSSLNIDIPDNTLGNWVMQSGKMLQDLLEEQMWLSLLANNYLQVDESPVKHLEKNKKGYLWVYLSPSGRNKLVVFEFSSTRSGDVAKNRLKNFTGIMQTDGYSGYNKLRKQDGITGLGCLTHARRKFAEVIKISKCENGIAGEFVEKIQPCYKLEEKLRKLDADFRLRKRLRQKNIKPIFKDLKKWLKQQAKKVLPNSKIGNAIAYALSQWKYITAYVNHGEAEIDTNLVENQIRPAALGKKNWMFFKNDNSGAINAFWYSIILSALLNGLNPRLYIHYLLMNVHKIRRKEINAAEVLPHVIDRKALDSFEQEQMSIAKKVFDST